MTGGQPFWLGITPEARTGAEQWKTGFHRIAVDLELPILVVTFCYRRKQAVSSMRSGQRRQQADMDAIAMLDDVQRPIRAVVRAAAPAAPVTGRQRSPPAS